MSHTKNAGLRILRGTSLLAGMIAFVIGWNDATQAMSPTPPKTESSTAVAQIGKAAPRPSAQVQNTRTASGEIALGALLILFALGLHIMINRRRTGERRVRVHEAPHDKKKIQDKRHWILWMNVRM